MSPAGMDPSTSPSLLLRLASPDAEAAWQEFLQRYRPLIRHWCSEHGLQPADAEDVTQEVLTRLVRVLPRFQYDPSRRFRGWLRVLVRNAACDYRCGRGKDPHTLTGDDERVAHILEKAAARGELAILAEEISDSLANDYDILRQAMERVRQSVKEKTWMAFELTELQGVAAQEAAGRLGIRVSSVYVYRNRIRTRIEAVAKQLLAGDPPSSESADA